MKTDGLFRPKIDASKLKGKCGHQMAGSRTWILDDFGHSEPKFVTFEDFRHHLWIDKEGFRVVLESWRSSLT